MDINKEELLNEIKSTVTDNMKSLESKYADMLLETTKSIEQNKDRDMKGIAFARCVKAQILAQEAAAKGANPSTFAVKYLKDSYAKDTSFVKEIEATEKALMEGNQGSFLIPEEFSADFIELLYNLTVVKAMGAKIVPMPRGNLSVNKLIGKLTAQYIPEGGAADFSDIKIGRIKLSSKKLMSLTAISNDLLRTNTYQADVILRDTMMESMVQTMDYALLYGTGGEDQPLGIRNTDGIQYTAKTAVITRAALYEMLAKLGKKNINVNDASIGFAINWDAWLALVNEVVADEGHVNTELTTMGTLLGRKCLVSNQIPSDTTNNVKTDVFLGKWNEVWVGEEYNFEFDLDKSTTFTDTDGKVINAFTSDFTVFRGIMKHDIKLARGEAFVVFNFYTVA